MIIRQSEQVHSTASNKILCNGFSYKYPPEALKMISFLLAEEAEVEGVCKGSTFVVNFDQIDTGSFVNSTIVCRKTGPDGQL